MPIELNRQDARDFLKKFWIQILVVIGMIAATTRVEKLGGYIQSVILTSIDHDSNGGHFLKPMWSIGLPAAAIFLAALLLLLSSTYIQSTLLSHEQRALKKAMKRSMSATTKIVNQMYDAEAHPGYELKKVNYIFEINRKGDVVATLYHEISATNSPLQFFTTNVEAHSSAPPVRHLDEINYKVTDNDPLTNVVYHQYGDDLHKKDLCVFFLPRIEPGQTRKFSITFHWPKMCQNMIKEGEEEFGFGFSASRRIKDLSYEIYLEDIGHQFSASIAGNRDLSQGLASRPSKKGWPGHEYSVTNAPGRGVYAVLLKRT